MSVKFHEKAIIIYGLHQAAEGTPSTPLATNPIVCSNLNFAITNTNEAVQFVGSEMSREGFTSLTDQYAETDFQAFMPYIGTMPGTGATLDASSVPFSDWFQGCGFSAIIGSGTGDAASVEITNSVSSNVFMTLDVRRSSPDIATQKSYKITDARGTFDLEMEIGKRTMLKFNWKGNSSVPAQVTAYTANFGSQKTNIAPVLRMAQIIQAEIVPWNNGAPVFTGAGTKNICFSKLSAPNVSGFDLSRFLTGCQEGFARGAVASDVVLTILEDAADTAGFNPDANIGNLFAMRLSYSPTGSAVPGKTVTIEFTKLQETDFKQTTVGSYVAKDVTFSNTGYFNLTFS